MILENENFIRVGNIARTYGKDGDVLARLYSEPFIDLLDSVESEKRRVPVFLLFDSLYTPFMIEKFEQKGGRSWIMNFTTFKDLPHAEELVGLEIFVQADLLRDSHADSDNGILDNLSELLGYKVLDGVSEEVGIITDVLEFPSNVCLQVKLSASRAGVAMAESEVLIPLHPNLVLDFNQEQKTIQIEIPSGLIGAF